MRERTASGVARKSLRAVGALLLCLGLTQGASAQDYPGRPIHMVLGFAPGGGGDILGRVIAQKLTERLKVAVTFENRAGANGVIAAEAVAKSKPDGYTLFFITPSHVLNGVSGQALPYDTLNDFTAVAQLATSTFVLVVGKVPARNLTEFVALLKGAPGKYNFASTGVGGATHLAGQAFLQAAGVKMLHVPYQGVGPVVTALRSGEVEAFFGSVVGLPAVLETGQVRALAVTSGQRSPSLSNVPTMREQGVDVDMTAYYGVLAPAKTPADVIRKLNEDLVAIIKLPEIVARLAADGAAPVESTPAAFSSFLSDQYKRLGPLVKAANESQH